MSVWTAGDMAAPVAEAAVAVAENGVPDMISLYAFAETAYGIGSYHELAANWITNGPESGFMPYPTYTGGLTEGWGTAGIGLGLRLGWSLGESMMRTYLGNGFVSAGGLGLGGGGLSGDIGVSYDAYGVNWITSSVGIGISMPGGGGYVSETYTLPLYESKK